MVVRWRKGIRNQLRCKLVPDAFPPRSPHACWVRLVLGLRGQEPRPPWIETAGSPTDGLHRRCYDPGAKGVKETPITPWPGKIFSLDSENLLRVRPCGTVPAHGAGRVAVYFKSSR